MLRATTVVLLALLCTPGSAAAEPAVWDVNGHWYELVQVGMLWNDARAAAETMSFMGASGHLVTLTSQAEADWVWALISEPFQGQEAVFIGAHQDPYNSRPADANWRWVTDEPWDYANWGPGEPNDYAGYEEFVAEFKEDFQPMWNDSPGHDLFWFVVEYEYAASPVEGATWPCIKAMYR